MIAGFDEVGRGAWAGPLVVAGVVLSGAVNTEFRDSKHYTQSARERAQLEVYTVADAISISVIPSQQIDDIGLGASLRLAFANAARSLQTVANEYIVDGSVDYLQLANSRAEPKADDKYQSVAASSIVAKIHRDRYMEQLHKFGDDYGFNQHFGYGTKLHRQRLSQYGPSQQHRYSFKPIKKLA